MRLDLRCAAAFLLTFDPVTLAARRPRDSCTEGPIGRGYMTGRGFRLRSNMAVGTGLAFAIPLLFCCLFPALSIRANLARSGGSE